MCDDFAKLFQDQKTSDISIVVGAKKFAAHKFVLYARSEVFERMLFADMKEKSHHSRQTPIEIKETTADAFEALLKYCYTNQFEPSGVGDDYTAVIDVYKLAHRFLIDGLMSLCATVLISMISCENLAAIYEFYSFYKIAGLLDGIKKFVRTNEVDVLAHKYPQYDNYKTVAAIFGFVSLPQSQIIAAIRDLRERNGVANVSDFKSAISLNMCTVDDFNALDYLKLFSREELYVYINYKYNLISGEYKSLRESHHTLLNEINKLINNSSGFYPSSELKSKLVTLYQSEMTKYNSKFPKRQKLI